MKTFIINLESSPERKAFMRSQAESLHLDYEFVPAVDGRKLTSAEMEEMCDMNKVREWAELLTPGMIGCSLSHYHVYRIIVDRQLPYAMILEDDTHLRPTLPVVAKNIEALLKNGELQREPVLLYFQSAEPVDFSSHGKIALSGEHGLYYPIDIWRPITTAAYIISYDCALRLTKLVYPIRYSPDSWAVYHREGAIAGLRCALPLVVNSGYFRSDIGYELHKPLNKLVRILEKKNIFPVPQLLKSRRRKLAAQQNRYRITDIECNWEAPGKELKTVRH